MGTRTTAAGAATLPVAVLAVTSVTGIYQVSALAAIVGVVAAAGIALGSTRTYLATGEHRGRRATAAWARLGIVVATLAVVAAVAHAVGLDATVAGERVEALAWGAVAVLLGGYGIAELRAGRRRGRAG